MPLPLPKSDSGSKELENIRAQINSALSDAASFTKPGRLSAPSAEGGAEAAVARQITNAVNLTSRIVNNHSRFNRTSPKIFDELTFSVRTISNNNDSMMRTFIDNNRQFQNILISRLTGEKIATSAAGTKTKLARKGVVSGSRLSSDRLRSAIVRKQASETEERLEADGKETSLLNKEAESDSKDLKDSEKGLLRKSYDTLSSGLSKTISFLGAEELAALAAFSGSLYLLKSYEEKQQQDKGLEAVESLEQKFPGFKGAFDKLSAEDLKKPETIDKLKGQFKGLFDGVPPLKLEEYKEKLIAAKGGTGTKIVGAAETLGGYVSSAASSIAGAVSSYTGGGSKESTSKRSLPKGDVSDVAGVGGVVRVKGNLTVLRTASGKTYEVATKYAKNFSGFIGDLEATGYRIRSIGGYSNRNIAGTGRKSIHAYGAAIDINPTQNPVTYGAKGRKPVTDMPANVQALAAKWGLGWGGAWKGGKQDAMHFSLAEGPGAILSRRILEQGGGDASTDATRSYSIPKSISGGTKDTGGSGRKSVAEMVRLAKEAGFSDSEAAIMGAIGAAESTGDPKAHNTKGRDNSYGLWQINMLGRMGPSRRKQLGIDSNEQLKDPKINARAAYMVYKQQGFGAWSVYKSGKYRQFLGTAQGAVSGGALAYAGKSSGAINQTPAGRAITGAMGKGTAVVGSNIVALGKQLQSMGLRVSEHPAFGGVRSRHSRTGGHYDGRAIDINVGRGVVEANHPKWGPIFDKIAADARRKGYKVIWRARGHYNHMHIAMPRGGLQGDPNAKMSVAGATPATASVSTPAQKQAIAAHKRAIEPKTQINNNVSKNNIVIMKYDTPTDPKERVKGSRNNDYYNNIYNHNPSGNLTKEQLQRSLR